MKGKELQHSRNLVVDFSARDHNFSLIFKVEKILKGSLDSIPSPSPSVKIQIMGGKVCLCPIHVVTFTLISNLATDYIQKRTGQALLFSFEYNLSPNLISK